MEEKLPREEIKIQKDVSLTLQNGFLTVKGKKGELKRDFINPNIVIEKSQDRIIISAKTRRRKDKALVGTFSAHIRNMIKGVSEGFEYRMKIVYAHFPIKAEVKGNEFIVSNFLGEKTPRKTMINENVKIVVSADTVILQGINLEEVSQQAANIERLTRIKDRDHRVFQDGIFITNKGD